jgi:hypothetical protein
VKTIVVAIVAIVMVAALNYLGLMPVWDEIAAVRAISIESGTDSAGRTQVVVRTRQQTELRRHWTRHAWRKWLSRRPQKARLSWEKMERLLERYPLPQPRMRSLVT